MARKLHSPATTETGATGRSECGRDVGTGLCGHPLVLLANEGEDATCKGCEKARQRATARSSRVFNVGMDEVWRGVAHLIAGRPVEQEPPLTRESWRDMCRGCAGGELVEDVVDGVERIRLDARRMTHVAWDLAKRPSHAMRCSCVHCAWWQTHTVAVSNWEAEQQIRPHRRHDCPFGSRDAAWHFLLRHRADGASVRSNTGASTARAEQSARLGANVQTTQRFDREDRAIRDVQAAVDIERLTRRAFVEASERRGLTVEQCVEVVLTTVATERVPIARVAEAAGLSVSAARALVKHARKVFTIEAAAAGYVPMPRAETGLVALVERRRAEMGEAG